MKRPVKPESCNKMLREKETVIRRALIILDGVIISFTFFLAYFLRQYFHVFYKLDLIPSVKVVQSVPASLNDYLVILFFLIPLWCAMLYWNGMYRSMRTKKFFEIAWIIVKAAFFTTLVFGTMVFLFKIKFISRLFFAIFIVLSTFSVLAMRTMIFFVMHYMRRHGHNYRRILIVGTGERAARFINRIKNHPEWGFRIEGLLDYEKQMVGQKRKGVKITGVLGDLQVILRDTPIDEVIFIVPRSVLTYIEDSLYICETLGVKATIAVDLFELKVTKARQTELDGIPMISFETTFAREWQRFVKRAIDVIVSVIVVVVFSPVFLAAAILIKTTSAGPVFFKQKRIGLNGRKFVLYKFRTMYKNAQGRLSEFEAMNEMKGPVFKIKNDPRITLVGKYLRKFSIDELPQLFNIFVGHMSLVGPRPPLSREVMQYKPWQRRRLSMRPGLTCLWQISGRNIVDFDDWMVLDLEYLDNWSLWLDFKIIIKTIPVVLFGIGAY